MTSDLSHLSGIDGKMAREGGAIRCCYAISEDGRLADDIETSLTTDIHTRRSRSMTLLQQVGGPATVEAVASGLYRRLFADPLTERYFRGMSVELQIVKMTGFLSAALAGERDVDRNLKESHADLAITTPVFGAVATALTDALTEAGVTPELTATVVRLAASRRDHVVTMEAESPAAWLHQQAEPSLRRVVEHPLYAQVTTPERLVRFMEHHVYAVWDFMSLLKALQRSVTCTDLPWVTRGDPAARRLINEIVLDEESDIRPDGRVASHYELYLDAMREVGADTAAIEAFIAQVREQCLVGVALETAPRCVQQFVLTTMDIVHQAQPHAIAAAFTLGREDAIPQMFQRLLVAIPAAPTMAFYLDRHISLDGDSHAQKGMDLIATLCGTSMTRWREAAEAARRALDARAALWDGVLERLL
jgi:truncated hemoglobin YjbI